MAISSATGLSDAQHGVQLRRAVVASTVGTIIEAYDFLLYVQVACGRRPFTRFDRRLHRGLVFLEKSA